MKRFFCMAVASVTLLAQLSSCAQPEAGSLSVPEIKGAQSTGSAPSSREKETASIDEKEQKVQIFIPYGYEKMQNMLEKFAAEQGTNLVFSYGAQGLTYSDALLKFYEEGNKPDIFWLENQAELEKIRLEGMLPQNLLGAGTSHSLYGLATHADEQFRLGGNGKMYGFPVGIYASGTIVNLPTLAKLLNTEDLPSLYKNLVNCSWEEWEKMVSTLDSFLQKPVPVQITLAKQNYTTLKFRPEEARALRGMFAVATAGGTTILQADLQTVLGEAMASDPDWQDAAPEEKSKNLQQPLTTCFQAISFETRHMTSEEGSISRGDSYLQQPLISQEAAVDLFKNGQALFLKGDSRTALAIEKEEAGFQGKLAVIPTKMPWQEGEYRFSMNQKLAVASQGYLCLANNADKAAENLLLAFFLSEEGRQAIAGDLNLIPCSGAVSPNLISMQTENLIASGQCITMEQTPEQTRATEVLVSDWLREALMQQTSWEERDETEFVNLVLEGMTLPPILPEMEKNE